MRTDSRRFAWITALSAPMIAALLAGASPTAAEGSPIFGEVAATDGPTGQSSTTVGLLTGDQVTFSKLPTGERTFTVDPAPRESGVPVTFTSASDGEHFYVIPSDAVQHVATNTLDLGLFDVAALARDGFSAESGAPPVIVQYRGEPSAADLASRARTLPGSTTRLASIDAVALDAEAGADLWSDLTEPAGATTRFSKAVERVWLDAKIQPTLDVSVPQIGAPAAWAAGYDGTGVTVAVLDTGIDANHPDLAGKVTAGAIFSEESSFVDKHGHGTHVASIIAGTGAASGGQYTGVAPGASLMIGKVFNDNGTGLMSWAIAGMEWAARGGADIVNLSLSSAPTDGTDPGSQAIDALSAETGTLFVVASGNDYRDAAVGAPGVATEALTVGAVDDNDTLADFSNRGPRRGDAAIKPNITAPGVGIIAARASGTSLGSPMNANYTALDGTSMATPHVAGAAALLAQANPDWEYERLKGALTSAAEPGAYTPFQQGSGRVDVARALDQQVYGPATVDFGRIADPATEPATRTLTYHNDSAADVTLDLAVDGRGWDGREVVAAARQLSASSVTVPAGGTATVALTVDPTQLDAGVYSGVITAATADGALRARTPWSVYEASNTHALNTSLLDRRGDPAGLGLPVWVVKVDPGFVANDPFRSWNFFAWTDEQGNASFEVAPGVYEIYGQITTWELGAKESTIAISSELTVDADLSVTLDAREAQLRNPRVGERVDLLFGEIGVLRHTPDGRRFEFSALFDQSSEWKLHASPTPDPSFGSAESYTKWIYESELVDVHSTGGKPITLHPEYWPSAAGPVLDGRRDLPVVFAGSGGEQELQAAQGKLALIRVEMPDEARFRYVQLLNEIDRISSSAAAIGVEGLLFYADLPGALAHEVRAQPILQLGLSHAEGEQLRRLIADNPQLRLSVDGRRSPERVYHLRLGNDGGFDSIAEPLVSKDEFATIPARYHSDTEGQEGSFAWFAFSPIMEFSGQLAVPIWGGTQWTEFVASRGPELRWLRENRLEGIALRSWDVFAGGDRRPVERWFESPIQYGAMDAAGDYPTTLRCTFCRQGDRFVSGQYRLDAQGDHYEFAWFQPPAVRLFNGDQEIPRQGSSWRWFQLPPGPGTYRLNMIYTQPDAPNGLAPRVETNWVFNSTPPEAGQLPSAYGCPFNATVGSCAFDPLIQLKYELGLSLLNAAPAGREFTFGVRAAPVSGAPQQPQVTDLNVWYSTDEGNTWVPGDVDETDAGEFDVTVDHPALSHTNQFVWLRVQASADDGSSVDQTIERAYRLTG